MDVDEKEAVITRPLDFDAAELLDGTLANDFVYVGRWLRQVGESFEKGDSLVAVDCLKAVTSILAPEAGKLTSILVAEGETFVGKRTLAWYLPTGSAHRPVRRRAPLRDRVESPPAFEAVWAAIQPALEKAHREVRSDIERWILDNSVPRRLRVTSFEGRIKTRLSTLRKAASRKIENPIVVLKEFKDLVGLRIVVANRQDAERVAEVVSDGLQRFGITADTGAVSDVQTGYKAIHISFRRVVDVSEQRFEIPCEVQIRTLAQDAWARLSHADFYKSGPLEIPSELSIRMRRLAEAFSVVDEEASAIRAAVDETVWSAVVPYASDDSVEPEALAGYLYDKHGVSLKGYWLELHLANFQRCHIETIGQVDALLSDDRVRLTLTRVVGRMRGRKAELGLLERLFFGAIASFKGEAATESAVRSYYELSALVREEAQEPAPTKPRNVSW